LILPEALHKKLAPSLRRSLTSLPLQAPSPIDEQNAPRLYYYLVWLKVLPDIDAALERLLQRLPEAPHKYYQKEEWIQYTKHLNGIESPAYRSVTKRPIILPVISWKQLQEKARRAAAAKAEDEKKRQEILAKPEETQLEEILELDAKDIENLPPEVLSKKLDQTDVSQLKEEQIEKIPTEVKEEKAWSASIWDAGKPGMDAFFKGIANQTAAGYVGVRYGLSLSAPDSPLMHDLQLFSLLLEMRGGALAGLRFIHDRIPEVKVTPAGTEQSFALSRSLLGWAFELNAPVLVDKIHVTPRLGSYSTDTRIAEGQVTQTTVQTVREAHIASATALGLEVDVELAKFFYILRGWASQDFSGLADSKQSATSTRLGLDFFVKGGGLGGKTSLSYLAFVTTENVVLKDTQNNNNTETVKIEGMTFGGLGLSLSW